jgi:hypothetical protein
MTGIVLRRLYIGAASAAALLFLAAPAYARCGSSDYSYAGLETRGATGGVSASIAALSAPQVERGHVAGWVGVSGEGSWMQIGLSAFPQERTNHVYVEVARPGKDPQYKSIGSLVPSLQHHRFALLELAGRPGWWRAWLDGKPVSAPVFLPGSHEEWKAQVTAESWNDGSGACNLYAYSFANVSLAKGGKQPASRLGNASVFQDAGYRLRWSAPSTFVAASVVVRAADRVAAASAGNP